MGGGSAQGVKRKLEVSSSNTMTRRTHPLNEKDIANMRNVYFKRTGNNPQEWERPTTYQLTTLNTV